MGTGHELRESRGSWVDYSVGHIMGRRRLAADLLVSARSFAGKFTLCIMNEMSYVNDVRHASRYHAKSISVGQYNCGGGYILPF